MRVLIPRWKTPKIRLSSRVGNSVRYSMVCKDSTKASLSANHHKLSGVSILGLRTPGISQGWCIFHLSSGSSPPADIVVGSSSLGNKLVPCMSGCPGQTRSGAIGVAIPIGVVISVIRESRCGLKILGLT